MLAEESRELLRLRWSRCRRFERRRSRRGGDCDDVDGRLGERLKSWKLRRGDTGSSWVGDDRYGVGSFGLDGGVIISWVCVSERMSLNSGAGGIAGAFWDGSVLRSSRLWRMLRSEGMMYLYLSDIGGECIWACICEIVGL
jgi:hypothetical protein